MPMSTATLSPAGIPGFAPQTEAAAFAQAEVSALNDLYEAPSFTGAEQASTPDAYIHVGDIAVKFSVAVHENADFGVSSVSSAINSLNEATGSSYRYYDLQNTVAAVTDAERIEAKKKDDAKKRHQGEFKLAA